MSKTSKSKKRKVIDKCRVFNENWKTTYFFTELDGKGIYVICQQSVAVLKDYNFTLIASTKEIILIFL